MTIQAAIFDIGNVLVPFDYERIFRKLEACHPDGARMDRGPIFAMREAFESGRLSRDEFLAEIRNYVQFEGSDEELVRVWEDIFVENLPMNSLVESLARRMPLFLLSNTNCIHREYLLRVFPVFRHFQGGVYSYEVGLLKPDPSIFLLAAKTLGVEPSRTLYLDDMPENARAARSVGYQVVEYDPHRHSEALEKISGILGYWPD